MFTKQTMQKLAQDNSLEVRQATADQYNAPQRNEGSLRAVLIAPQELEQE